MTERAAPDPEAQLSIDDLSGQAGVPVRTIRYYIAGGLLPGPGARGKGAAYTDDHLVRLKLIRLLIEQRVPLAEIRERLATLTPDEIRSLLQTESRRRSTLDLAAGSASPKDYISALLDRTRAHSPASLRRGTLPSQPAAAAPSATAAPGPAMSGLEASSPAPPPSDPVDEAEAPATTDALPWRRLQLAPGVELHIRADAEHRYHQLVERLLSLAAAFAGSARR